MMFSNALQQDAAVPPPTIPILQRPVILRHIFKFVIVRDEPSCLGSLIPVCQDWRDSVLFFSQRTVRRGLWGGLTQEELLSFDSCPLRRTVYRFHVICSAWSWRTTDIDTDSDDSEDDNVQNDDENNNNNNHNEQSYEYNALDAMYVWLLRDLVSLWSDNLQFDRSQLVNPGKFLSPRNDDDFDFELYDQCTTTDLFLKVSPFREALYSGNIGLANFLLDEVLVSFKPENKMYRSGVFADSALPESSLTVAVSQSAKVVPLKLVKKICRFILAEANSSPNYITKQLEARPAYRAFNIFDRPDLLYTSTSLLSRPIVAAAAAGRADVVAYLLSPECGAYPNARGGTITHPLEIAINKSDVDVVKALTNGYREHFPLPEQELCDPNFQPAPPSFKLEHRLSLDKSTDRSLGVNRSSATNFFKQLLITKAFNFTSEFDVISHDFKTSLRAHAKNNNNNKNTATSLKQLHDDFRAKHLALIRKKQQHDSKNTEILKILVDLEISKQDFDLGEGKYWLEMLGDPTCFLQLISSDNFSAVEFLLQKFTTHVGSDDKSDACIAECVEVMTSLKESLLPSLFIAAEQCSVDMLRVLARFHPETHREVKKNNNEDEFEMPTDYSDLRNCLATTTTTESDNSIAALLIFAASPSRSYIITDEDNDKQTTSWFETISYILKSFESLNRQNDDDDDHISLLNDNRMNSNFVACKSNLEDDELLMTDDDNDTAKKDLNENQNKKENMHPLFSLLNAHTFLQAQNLFSTDPNLKLVAEQKEPTQDFVQAVRARMLDVCKRCESDGENKKNNNNNNNVLSNYILSLNSTLEQAVGTRDVNSIILHAKRDAVRSFPKSWRSELMRFLESSSSTNTTPLEADAAPTCDHSPSPFLIARRKELNVIAYRIHRSVQLLIGARHSSPHRNNVTTPSRRSRDDDNAQQLGNTPKMIRGGDDVNFISPNQQLDAAASSAATASETQQIIARSEQESSTFSISRKQLSGSSYFKAVACNIQSQYSTPRTTRSQRNLNTSMTKNEASVDDDSSSPRILDWEAFHAALKGKETEY